MTIERSLRVAESQNLIQEFLNSACDSGYELK